MKKLALLPVLLILSVVYAETLEVLYNDKYTAEPDETVRIELKIKNVSGTYLENCKAFVDLELLEDEIQHFTIISEPSWETMTSGSEVKKEIKIKITTEENNVKLRIPIVVSGGKGSCVCDPFMEGPFYVEITVKNRGIEAFNHAESLYNERKYEEAMEKYDEAKKYFLRYSDEKNAQICLEKISRCRGYMKLNAGISYFNTGDLDNAKKEFEDAKSMFESIDDEDMVVTCEQWIKKCTPEPVPTTTPSTTSPSTTIPSTTSPPTTPPGTTPVPTNPTQTSSTTLIFSSVLVAAMVLVIIAAIKMTKK